MSGCTLCEKETDDLVAHLKEDHPDQIKTGDQLEQQKSEPERPNPRRPRPPFEEATPWVRYVAWADEAGNRTTHHNLASYALQGVVGFEEWALHLVMRHEAEESERTGKPMPHPAHLLPRVKALTRRLLRAADLAQAAVRPDHTIDRMAASHTRARGAVRTAVACYPIPWGADEDEKRQWECQVAQLGAGFLKAAMELIEPDPIGEDDEWILA